MQENKFAVTIARFLRNVFKKFSFDQHLTAIFVTGNYSKRLSQCLLNKNVTSS